MKREWVRRMGRVVILGAVFLGILWSSSPAKADTSLPASHLIPDIIWHQQQNGLFCGPGSLEIVFDYLGPDIDQKAIADVARSSSIGTWTFDIQRAGHFSYLSAAQGYYFPNEAPAAGFPERPLGYASFSHASDTFWVDDLKAIIAADLPVIVLNNFTPDAVGGDHYRVVIGYDDTLGLIYVSDPWGREFKQRTDKTGVAAYTYAEFQFMWNRASYGTDLPYFGVVMAPWQVKLSSSGKLQAGSVVTVTADITYPCPKPFDATQFPASDTTATIALPAGMTLVSGPESQSMGTLAAGSTRRVTWNVRLDASLAGKTIQVEAKGYVSGAVPEAVWNGQSNSYPAYSYTDAIGGQGTLQF